MRERETSERPIRSEKPERYAGRGEEGGHGSRMRVDADVEEEEPCGFGEEGGGGGSGDGKGRRVGRESEWRGERGRGREEVEEEQGTEGGRWNGGGCRERDVGHGMRAKERRMGYSTGVERGIRDVRRGAEMGRERDARASADGRRGRTLHNASKIIISPITITSRRERRTGNTMKQITSRTCGRASQPALRRHRKQEEWERTSQRRWREGEHNAQMKETHVTGPVWIVAGRAERQHRRKIDRRAWICHSLKRQEAVTHARWMSGSEAIRPSRRGAQPSVRKRLRRRQFFRKVFWSHFDRVVPRSASSSTSTFEIGDGGSGVAAIQQPSDLNSQGKKRKKLEETRAHTLEDIALFRTRNVAKIDGNRRDNGAKPIFNLRFGEISSNPRAPTRGVAD
ncbi:hypothetical protein B0H13DRAFT_1919783 [Mycena leptocephala]|nr:hypothetical protein B0H13DRAFT_1919783 [Mycena leptocephala]